MLRIQRVVRDDVTVLELHGHLSLKEVDLVEHELAAASCSSALDLSELRSVDRAGVDWLDRLDSQGLELVNPSPYLRHLIERARSARGPDVDGQEVR